MATELEVVGLGRDILSRIAEGSDLYTSSKSRAFNTYLSNVGPFPCTNWTGQYQRNNRCKARSGRMERFYYDGSG